MRKSGTDRIKISGFAFLCVANLSLAGKAITPIARDLVFDQMDSGVLVLDPNRTVVDASDPACSMLDVSDPDGDSLSSVVPERTGPRRALRRRQGASEVVSVDTSIGRCHYALDISAIDGPRLEISFRTGDGVVEERNSGGDGPPRTARGGPT